MGDIWNVKDPSDLVVMVNDAVLEKCGYGENVSVLTAQERLFYLVQCLWMEINNGGFCQYFDNSSGDDAPETLSALREIGADFVADLMEKAMAQFGAAYPTNREERLDLTAGWADDDPRIVLWWACDNAFFQDQKGDACLDACCYAYLMKNKNSFLL